MPYTDRIDAGTVSGIRLYLTRHFEHNGKHYYYLSRSGLDQSNFADRATHTEIDNLFNPGEHTIATQEGSHDGSDDERSIIVSGGFGIVLPTINELLSLLDAGNFDDVTLPYPFSKYRTANYENLTNPLAPFHSVFYYGGHYVSLQSQAHFSNTDTIVQFIETATPDDPTTLLFLPPPTSLKTTLSRVTLLRGQTSILNFTFSNPVSGFSLSNITNTEDTISDFETVEANKSYKAILTPDADTDRPTNSFGVDLSGIQYEVAGTGPYGSVPIQIINYIVDTIPITTVPDIIEPVPAWPDILPAPSQTSYQIKPIPSFKRTEMTSGIARQRRVTRNPPTTFTMFWDMSRSEFAVFEAFFIYDLHDGQDWFKMDYATGIGCVEGEFRFTNIQKPYTSEAITSESFRIRTTLELRYKNILSRTDFAAKVNMNPDDLVLPIWPSNLPVPLVRSYKIEPKSAVYRTSLKEGYANHRVTQNDETTIFQMRWHMTNEQFSLFQAFYQYNLNDGQSWFYMDHAEGIGFVGGEFRFFEKSFTYRAQYMSENYFSVDAKIERRGKKLMYRDTYNIITCDDETIKDSVFNVDLARLHTYLHHDDVVILDHEVTILTNSPPVSAVGTLPSIQGEW